MLRSITSRLNHRLRNRWLRKNFRNGEDFVQALRGGPEPREAVRHDGRTIAHPASGGFLDALLECWYRQAYFPRGFYRPHADDVIIDAGANIGLFSLLALEKFPEAHVTAIEPFPENFQFLNNNLGTFAAPHRWTAPRVALGASSGMGSMERVGERSLDHVLHAAPSSNGFSVDTIPLDGLFDLAKADRIAFLKLDIEGSEKAAMDAASPSTLERIDHVAAEYHDNLTPGCLDSLRTRLRPTHHLKVVPSAMLTCGMLFARLKTL